MASAELHFDFFPEDQEVVFSVPVARDRVTFKAHSVAAKHSRSMSSAPVYQPSYGSWDFLQSKEDSKPDKTRRWSCMLQRHDGERRNKRRVILEQDVQELQMRLQDEMAVRKTLEKALNSSYEPLSDNCNISPQTKALIKEIANLEIEVVNLEQHVLSLYRKAFDSKLLQEQHKHKALPIQQQLGTEHNTYKRQKKAYSFQHRRHVSATSQGCHSVQDTVSCNHSKTRHASLLGGKLSISEESYRLPDVAIQETRVFPSDQATKEARVWPSVCDLQKEEGTPTKALGPCISAEHCYETSSKLSEEMVRCMAAIYCKLADPPLTHLGGPVSPPSSTSTSSTSTSRDVSSDGWSQESGTYSTEGYSSMIEVPWIRVDKERLAYAAHALRNFRSMVEQLERVNPGEMKHDEKLAFWINIYNALVMHAYLAYGIARSHLKRVSLLQKAAYKVGAFSINAYTIEHSILGCRSQRPAQWLQTLLAPLTKFKTEERRAYALNNPEPLVCFALCSGGRSDPAVRPYTPKNVKRELEAAKRDFFNASITVRNEKVLLPRLLESYARDAGIPSGKLLDWICQNVSQKQQSLIRSCIQGKSHKSSVQRLEWLAYDFNFRYIFVRELARCPPACAR